MDGMLLLKDQVITSELWKSDLTSNLMDSPEITHNNDKRVRVEEIISELTSESVFQVNAADAFISSYNFTQCGNEEERGLCSQTLHILCESCDAVEVFLVVTGNRRCLTSVR